MSERRHEQTCFKLSARPTPVIDVVHNADVNTDINTDRPENSAPRNISDVNLFKCNVLDTQEGRPMEGMTKFTPGRPVRLRTGRSWYGQRTIAYFVLAGAV